MECNIEKLNIHDLKETLELVKKVFMEFEAPDYSKEGIENFFKFANYESISKKLDKDLNKEALKIAGIAYAGKDGQASFLVNPIDGPVEKLKNVTIYTGTYDILNPDVKVFIEKAKNQNIEISLKEYQEKGHIWIVKDTTEQAYKDLVGQIV